MISQRILKGLGLALLFIPVSATALNIGFDQPTYTVAPGAPLIVTVQMEAPVPEGLYSYGVKITFEPAQTPVISPANISVPPTLDFFGVMGPGAFREVGNDYAGVKGTISFTSFDFYAGAILAGFQVAYPLAGTYSLGLGLFNTMGDTESLFVSGTGEVLDDSIQFGAARIRVRSGIPETLSASWAAFAVLLLLGLDRMGLRQGKLVQGFPYP